MTDIEKLQACIAALTARNLVLETALRDIEMGCNDGIFRDENGDECGEDDEGAQWEDFDLREQNAQLYSVRHMALAALNPKDPT